MRIPCVEALGRTAARAVAPQACCVAIRSVSALRGQPDGGLIADAVHHLALSEVLQLQQQCMGMCAVITCQARLKGLHFLDQQAQFLHDGPVGTLLDGAQGVGCSGHGKFLPWVCRTATRADSGEMGEDAACTTGRWAGAWVDLGRARALAPARSRRGGLDVRGIRLFEAQHWALTARPTWRMARPLAQELEHQKTIEPGQTPALSSGA